MLKSNDYKDTQIKSHLSDLRKQKITQIFYLPKGGKLFEESFVLFDKINNCENTYLNREKLPQQKIFTLSNYGFYLFLIKISIHFSRIREGIDRV